MPEVVAAVQSVDTRRRPEPEEGPLVVVYEDAWLLVLDKPPGVVVHPTYKHPSGTLLNAVLWRLRDRPDARPGILTRLDKDTSGLVVVGLGPDTHARLQRAAGAGHVRKEYLAVVRGTPDPRAGRVGLPLGRSPEDRRHVIVRADGATAETIYEVLSTHGERSLVRCELVTGRTHQIRVHLSARGWPVVGDARYGGAACDAGRQALHAWRVSLPHPDTGERLVFESPLPDDLRQLSGP